MTSGEPSNTSFNLQEHQISYSYEIYTTLPILTDLAQTRCEPIFWVKHGSQIFFVFMAFLEYLRSLYEEGRVVHAARFWDTSWKDGEVKK